MDNKGFYRLWMTFVATYGTAIYIQGWFDHPSKTDAQMLWILPVVVMAWVVARTPRSPFKWTANRVLRKVTIGGYTEMEQPEGYKRPWWSTNMAVRDQSWWKEFLRPVALSLAYWAVFMGIHGSYSLNLASKNGDGNLVAFGLIVILYGVRNGIYLANTSIWGKWGFYGTEIAEAVVYTAWNHSLKERRREEDSQRMTAEERARAFHASGGGRTANGGYDLRAFQNR